MANITTKIVLRNDTLSAWQNANPVLLKGEIGLARLSGDLSSKYELRIGDGTSNWNSLSATNIIIPAENVSGLTETIASLSTSYYETFDEVSTLTGNFVNGDIAVKKSVISGDLQEFTAYRYDSTLTGDNKWRALDKNYNAENVYFDENIVITQAFGKYGINSTTGRGTLSCAGWSLKDLISNSFSDAKSAGQNKPSVTWGNASDFGTVEAGTWLTGGNADNAITIYYTDGSWKEYNSGKTAGNRILKENITATRTALCAENFNGNVFDVDAINASYTYNAETDAVSVLAPKSTFELLPAISNTDLSVQATDDRINLYKYSATADYEAGTTVPVNNLGAEEPGNKIAGGTFTRSEVTVGIPAGNRYCFWGYLTDGNQYDITKDATGKVTECNITSDQIRAFMTKKDAANRTCYGTSFPSTTTKATNFTVGANTKQIIFAAPSSTSTKKIKVFNNSNLGAGLDFDHGNEKVANAFTVAGANNYKPISYDMWCVTFGAAFSTQADLAISWE